MNNKEENAIYLRSEWIDGATGAPLEEHLTTAELDAIIDTLEWGLEYTDDNDEDLKTSRSAFKKLLYFTNPYPLGDD